MAWSFDSSVESIVAASRKRIWWLFEVDDTYFWSTKHVPSSIYNSQEYTFKILSDSFTNIELNRAKPEQGVQAPSTLSFTIHNKDNVLSASTFSNSTIIVRLIMSEADGTPEEVRRDVLERCEIFSRDGGFIFAPIHNILPEVPPENIIAAYDAVSEFNGH